MDNLIQDDDYVISDSGRLGSDYYVTVINNEFCNYEEMIKAIKRHMDENNWWPSVWYVNDHGNILEVNIYE